MPEGPLRKLLNNRPKPLQRIIKGQHSGEPTGQIHFPFIVVFYFNDTSAAKHVVRSIKSKDFPAETTGSTPATLRLHDIEEVNQDQDGRIRVYGIIDSTKTCRVSTVRSWLKSEIEKRLIDTVVPLAEEHEGKKRPAEPYFDTFVEKNTLHEVVNLKDIPNEPVP